MDHLAKTRAILTPATLANESSKLSNDALEILAVHIKPAYRDTVAKELLELGRYEVGSDGARTNLHMVNLLGYSKEPLVILRTLNWGQAKDTLLAPPLVRSEFVT